MSFIKNYWRLLALGLVTLLVVGGTVTGLLWLFAGTGEEEAAPIDKVEVAASDEVAAAEQASQFILTAGTFGVNPSTVTKDSINDIFGAVYTNSGAYGGSSIGISRTELYKGAVQKYLMPGSELFYPSGVVTAWSDYFREKQNLASYVVTKATPVAGQAYRTPDGERVILPVEVTFNSAVTVYEQTDRSDFWDGVWNVYKKSFDDNKTTVYMVQDTDGKWKVDSLTAIEFPYLLATWETPDTTIYAQPETMQLADAIATGANGEHAHGEEGHEHVEGDELQG